MPVFSMPGKYGIGDFGKESYKFIDFLRRSGQKVWQILPLVQTGYGNSPYSSVSSASFNPFFISPEKLKEEGLLTASEIKFTVLEDKYINYSTLYTVRYPLLEKAFLRFNKEDAEFKAYVKSKESYDYALFMTLKYATGQKHFYEWEDKYKRRDRKALRQFAKDYSDKLLFWQFVQFKAKKQWLELKKYANDSGIKIMGDMPLYVALDSVDVWKNPELFKLDENFVPKTVAGVPPDYFCKDGQLWGNPVYDYDVHEKTGFSWWVNRIKRALKIYDYVRIDHFRGLDRYYQVENGAENASNGEWVDVPSKELFNAIHKKINRDRIIAEDLGIIDDGVRRLLQETGYPGMKILSFAFNGDKDNLYLPERLNENCVCYTGTHDNDTLIGLMKNCSEWDFNNLLSGVNNSLNRMEIFAETENYEQIACAIIKLGMKSNANLFIFPMQDILKKDSEYRINEPGTVNNRNWSIRFSSKDFSNTLASEIKKLTKKYKRL